MFEKISFISNGKFNYSKLNKRLKGEDKNKTFTGDKAYGGSGYNKSVKIKGNFSSSYNYVNNTVKKMKYNLLKENCSWACIEILKHSSISICKKRKLENLQYRYMSMRIYRFGIISMFKRVKVPNVIVPSIIHNKIVSIFS